MMDFITSIEPGVLAVGVGGLGLLIGVLLVLSTTAGRSARAADEMASLRGRLAQIAESQAAQQAQLAERLQSQERSVTRSLEERLTDLSRRVGDQLSQSSTRHHESMTDLRERLAVIDRAQKTITELSSQVVGLQDILANKQARGAFGEIQLNDIVASILPPSAYGFQVSLGQGRVDCLLKLPNPPGPIAIDAKFPLESYRTLREAADDTARTAAGKRLALDVRTHVKAIAEKYIIPGETADSALLFLPSEAVYAELHANFRPVIEESFRARVWIVSPTTLMATLNTVRAVLKDVHLREQAGAIQAEIAALLQDVERLDDRVGKLQRHFDQSAEDLRRIRISTEKVTKRGERIAALEVGELQGEVLEADAGSPPKPRLVVEQTLGD